MTAKAHRIYLGGNIYGVGNIGDDAVLHGIVKLLRMALPDANLTVGTSEGKGLDCLSPSPEYINIQNWSQLGAAIRRSDCFISGGGTLIGDELNLGFPLEYNYHLISTAKRYGKRVAMLGIGANALRHKQGKRIARRILSLCDLVTVRDGESREVCLSLGANPSRTVTTADPAFLLEPTETDRTREVKNRLLSKGRLLGVNVVNEAWSHLSEYKSAIARASEHLASHYDFTPVFFCNEIRTEAAYDWEANRETAVLLNCDHEIMDPVYYSPGEMIDLISTFEFVIAMRMHALIFAAVAGVPFATVSRVDKVDNFMRQFDLRSSGSVDSCDSSQLIADVEQLLERREVLRGHISEQVSTLRHACCRNVDLIRDLLTRQRTFWQEANTRVLQLVLYGDKARVRFQRLLRRRLPPRSA